MASGATCWTSQAAAAARDAAAALSAAVLPACPCAPGPPAAGDPLALVRPPPWVSATPRAAAASRTAASSTTVSTRQRELPVRDRTWRCHHSRMVVASTVPQDGVVLAGVAGWAGGRSCRPAPAWSGPAPAWSGPGPAAGWPGTGPGRSGPDGSGPASRSARASVIASWATLMSRADRITASRAASSAKRRGPGGLGG